MIDSHPGNRAGDRAPRRWPSWQTVLALLLAGAAAVTLFASFMSTSAPQADQAGEGPAPAAAATFTALTSQGEKVPVPGGSKPSVLFFFSIGCGACGPGTRALAEVQNSSPAAANYVAVDIAPYETAEEIKEFLAGNNASSLAFASDSGTQLITAYQINQVSTAVVLDAAGREVFRAVEPGAAELRTALAAAGAG